MIKIMRKNKVLTLLLVLFTVIFFSALTMTIRALIPYLQADNEYENIEQTYVRELSKKEDELETTSASTSDLCPITVDFEELKKKNPEITGWIYGEDTKINYPVVRGSDNHFYLTHMADGSKNSSGAIFMDFRNSDRSMLSNTILYGHHMKNGSMFAGLQKFKSQEYYETHSSFYYLTQNQSYRLEILRAGVTSSSSDIYQLNFSSGQEKEGYLSECNKQSCISSIFQEQPEAPLMTLSTCSYENADSRFVVQGQLIELQQ